MAPVVSHDVAEPTGVLTVSVDDLRGTFLGRDWKSEKASKVVRNHWSSVTALATALVDRMEIDGKEATAIIEAARAVKEKIK